MMYPEGNWWTGVVENRHDPMKLGRCQVRIMGYHSPDLRKMPTEKLPWSVPMMPIVSGSQTGVGWSPTGPVEGTHVVGFFRDGEDGQEPVMMGTLPGIPKKGGDKKGGPFMDNRWRVSSSMYELSPENNAFAKNNKTGMPDIEGSVPRRPGAFVFAQKGQQVDALATVTVKQNTFKIWELDPTPYPSKRLIQMPTIPRTALGYDDLRGSHAFRQDEHESNKISDASNVEKSQVYFREAGRNVLGQFELARSSSQMGKSLPNSFQEPSQFYKARYPYNHVIETESGHLIERDDTPQAERLLWQHRTGTFTEFGPTGIRIERTHADRYETTSGNAFEGVVGFKAITGSGIHLNATGSEIVMKGTGSAEINFETTSGNMNMNIGGFLNQTAKGSMMNAQKFFGIEADQYALTGPNGSLRWSAVPDADNPKNTTGLFALESKQISFSGASDISGAASGNINWSPKGGFLVKGGYSKEFYTNEFIGNNRTPGTDWNGKEIESMMGNIVLKVNTGNPKLGAIEFIVKPAPIPDMVDMPTNLNGLTFLKLNPVATQSIMMQTPTFIDTTATIGTFHKTGLALIDYGALAMINAKLMLLDSKMTFIGGVGASPAVLGDQFATEYAAHLHLSPAGPTGPPTTAAKVMTLLSKKIIFGG